jgi:hypothetical protein
MGNRRVIGSVGPFVGLEEEFREDLARLAYCSGSECHSHGSRFAVRSAFLAHSRA